MLPVAGLLLTLALLSLPGAAQAQGTGEEQDAQPAPGPPERARWTAAAELALYVIPDEENYLWPSLAADRDWLHLEARYNYEDKNTVSFWAGANFDWGERVNVAVTPMFGVVTGDTDGVAPGFLFTLSAGTLEFYSEGEWVFDAGEKTDSFYYSWTELSLSPWDWLSMGLAAQKTRAYASARSIERGVLTGINWKNASLTGYVFEPFSDQPTVVIAFGVEF